MLPMSFTCMIAAAVWHYTGRGLRGWLWSFVVIAVVYSSSIDVARHATRVCAAHLPFRRMSSVAFGPYRCPDIGCRAGRRHAAKAHARYTEFCLCTFVGVAALFFLLGAEFVGLVLVFVYIGAVAVLVVFTILSDPA